MGSSGIGNGSGSGGCCDMSLKCWCRWRWDHCFLSTTFLFLLSSFVVFASIATFFAWLTFPPYDRPSISSFGCQPDSEGSWSIGIFYGDSPFSLKPIESRNVWKNDSSAWPVANPVFTCASASDAGFPSNFVADPFLFDQKADTSVPSWTIQMCIGGYVPVSDDTLNLGWEGLERVPEEASVY